MRLPKIFIVNFVLCSLASALSTYSLFTGRVSIPWIIATLNVITTFFAIAYGWALLMYRREFKKIRDREKLGWKTMPLR